ncbi:MAG: 3-oxoacyl-[acyl-carrier-protein] synthase-3 [Arenicella sp.]|jgi:3-oxoacyl-[acyl-carrier-protein] synthase-3
MGFLTCLIPDKAMEFTMYHPQKKKAKIFSTGVHLPSQVVKSVDLLEEIRSECLYGIDKNWMSETMGIEERRMAPDAAKPSDLAIPAARDALRKIPEIDTQHIDLVIFCGIERDQPEPATAHTIQNALGLNARYAYDVANACYGFIDAMHIATNYIECGIVRYALVVTGEVPTRVLKAAVEVLKSGVDVKTARNIIGALSVGDAGGAAILGVADNNDSSGFELFNTISVSSHVDKCIYKQRQDGSIEGHMIMGQLAGMFIRNHHKLIDDTLNQLGWKDFDWMLSHQIGKRPFDKLSNMNGVTPNKMIKTLDKLGNITSATFPVNFNKLVEEQHVRSGDKIGGCFAGSGFVVGQFGYTF